MTTEKIQSEYNIPLGNGKYAMIDLRDLDKVLGYNWCFSTASSGVCYAIATKRENGKRRNPKLHQIILGKPPRGLEIGHKDGDGLNCHKNNLHFVTHQQNAQGRCRKKRGTSSRYRGVCRDVARDKWTAGIFVAGKKLNLGRFSIEIDAAKAYDTAARKYYGEFASPNL